MPRIRSTAYSLIRSSERFLKTDMIYASKGGFWMLLNQALYAAGAFALALLFARYVSKETYGTYKYILALVGFLGAFTLTGLETALMQSVARGFERIVRHAWWLKIRWSLGSSFGALVIGVYYLVHANETLGISMIAAAVCMPFMNFGATISAFLQGRKNFRDSALIAIVQNLIFTAIMAGVILYIDDSLSLTVAYLALSAIASSVAFGYTMGRYHPNDADYPDAHRLSKHVSVMNIFSTLSNQIDKLVIFHFLGPVSLSIYSFAYALPQQFEALLRIGYNLALPKMAGLSRDDARRVVLSRTWQVVAVALTLSAIYIIAAPYLYQIFFPAYVESVRFSQILIFDFVLASIGSLAGAFLDSQVMIRQKYVLNLMATIPKTICIIVLGSMWGVWGVVTGLLLGMVIGQMTNLIIVYRAR